MSRSLHNCLLVTADSESQLYIVRDVDSDAPELFDPSLGNFMKNTFVLALEYMFVQVTTSPLSSQGNITSFAFVRRKLIVEVGACHTAAHSGSVTTDNRSCRLGSLCRPKKE